MADRPGITFISCIESGFLEDQLVRMVESLRRWGGRFAEVPVIAVKPRFGPPLAPTTRRALVRLRVRYVRAPAGDGYEWFPFFNKPRALLVGEACSATETIGWLDSDLLFVGEPDQLALRPEEDFAACASDQEMGTTGPESPFHALWEQHCRTLGMAIEDLPWITTEVDRQRIRLYWNSGVFVYRRTTRFAQHFSETCKRLLDSRMRSNHPDFSLTINEMGAVGFAMVRERLRWRALTDSHNHPICSTGHAQRYNADRFRAARIIHYHDAMWPHFWPEFLRCLRAAHPDVAAWLETWGPMRNVAPLPWRVMSKALNYQRGRRASAYLQACTVL